MRIHLRLAFVAVLCGALVLPGASAALALPTHDDFDNAIVIGALPFIDSIDTTSATAADDDPTTCANNGSVWYTFTATADMTITADTVGSGYDTVLSAYTGARGDLSQVPGACNDDFGSGVASRIGFAVAAGTTYNLLVGQCCGIGGSGGGPLVFHVTAITAPANDNFANATAVSALPFTDNVETVAATIEQGEPTPSCGFGTPLAQTVWYAFTPSVGTSVSASIGFDFSRVVAVYTGNSLPSLTGLGCRRDQGLLTFRAEAGSTYYLQIGLLSGQAGPLQFSLRTTPSPVANFFPSPSDPSIFDDVRFFDASFDPGGAGFQSLAWDFGDGTRQTGCCPVHRYAVDGDYVVTLTVTTVDGRVATVSQAMHVVTHDVAIARIKVPNLGRVGQTRPISVEIRNGRYPEIVEVTLFRSTPAGFETVGRLRLSVPVRNGGQTTPFDFTYTFSEQDAAIGKITFRAVATIIGSRDALSADNEAISPPTTVTR